MNILSRLFSYVLYFSMNTHYVKEIFPEATPELSYSNSLK